MPTSPMRPTFLASSGDAAGLEAPVGLAGLGVPGAPAGLGPEPEVGPGMLVEPVGVLAGAPPAAGVVFATPTRYFDKSMSGSKSTCFSQSDSCRSLSDAKPVAGTALRARVT